MNGYLLDTDICIFFLQGKYGLSEKIGAVGIENCFISEITIAELLFGAENSTNYEKHIEEVSLFEQHFQLLKTRPFHLISKIWLFLPRSPPKLFLSIRGFLIKIE